MRHVYLVPLLLVLFIIPITPQAQPISPASEPRLGAPLSFTGTYNATYGDYSLNLTFELNLTITALSISGYHYSYNMTYSYSDSLGNLYEENFSNDLPGLEPLYVPLSYFAFPVAIITGFLGDYLNNRFEDAIRENDIVNATLDENILTVFYGFDEGYRNATIDVFTGIFLSYTEEYSDYYLHVEAVEYPSVDMSVDSESLSGYYERAIETPGFLETLVVAPQYILTIGDLRLMVFEYYIFYNNTLRSAPMVTGSSPMSHKPLLISPVRVDTENINASTNELRFITPTGLDAIGEFGLYEYSIPSRVSEDVYFGYIANGAIAYLYIRYTFGIFLTYIGDGFPAMASAEIEAPNFYITSTDPDAILSIYNEEGPIDNSTVGEGYSYTVTGLTLFKVYNVTGGVYFYGLSSPLDHVNPTIHATASSELEVTVYDNEPIVNYKLYINGTLYSSGFAPAFSKFFLSYTPGGLELRIIDLDGHQALWKYETNSVPSLTYSYTVDGNTLTITGHIDDDDSSFTLVIHVDGEIKYNGTVSSDFSVSIELTEGSHNVTIIVVDPAGNRASASFTVEISSEESSGGTGGTGGLSTTTIGLLIGIIAILIALVLFFSRSR